MDLILAFPEGTICRLGSSIFRVVEVTPDDNIKIQSTLTATLRPIESIVNPHLLEVRDENNKWYFPCPASEEPIL